MIYSARYISIDRFILYIINNGIINETNNIFYSLFSYNFYK